MSEEGKPLDVQETGPFTAVDDASPRAEAIWECAVRRWTAATVVESCWCAPSIPLSLRAGAFAVLDVHFDEVVSVDVRESTARGRPTREVPMFASWFEPPVQVSTELEEKIRALCFTAAEEMG